MHARIVCLKVWIASLALSACGDSTDASSGGAANQGGNGGGGAAADSAWLDIDWPTSSVDPISAGDILFDPALAHRWQLSLGPSDVSCPASDCPGGAADAVLGPGYEVAYYAGQVVPSVSFEGQFLWRMFDAGKASLSTTGGADVGRGTLINVMRRACDGALVALSDSEYEYEPGQFTIREDFGEYAVVRDDAGTRVVFYPPPFQPNSPLSEEEKQTLVLAFAFGSDGTLTFRTEGDSVYQSGFAFRADEKSAVETFPPSALELQFVDPAATPEQIVALYQSLEGSFDGVPVVALEQLVHHPEPEVRSAALAHVIPWYLNPDYTFNRRFMDDRMMAQLLYDSSPELRLEAAQAQATIRASWPESDFHCSVETALERCRDTDAEASVRQACEDVLSALGPSFGNCTLEWP